ncbi:hypothetical protein GY45DRAFT_1332621 [Cubamyces sp. BRFM 1775]|nr:hypothetical protein GY45DRAFT_1332621 [Cubamyces sp. BRFM 1775]
MAPASHPLQTIYKVADASLLRNKNGYCRNCNKPPSMIKGEKFLMCTGCKIALYCSKACQQEDWGRHKPQCQFIQDSLDILDKLREGADDADVATLDKKLVRHALLRDFLEAHRLSLRMIASAQLFLTGGTASAFGADPQVHIVPLRFQPSDTDAPSSIDPARAFKIGKGVFVSLKRVLEESTRNGTRLAPMWEAAEGYRARLAAGERCVNPYFTGLLPVLYQAELGAMSMEFYPQCAEDAPFQGERPTSASEQAKMRMQERFVELGVFLRPDPDTPKGQEQAYVPGYLHKSGSKWKWKAVFKDFYNNPEWNGTRPENRPALMERRVAVLRRT